MEVNQNTDDGPVPTSLPPYFKPGVCRCNKSSRSGRNLVVCIDGPLGNSGTANTNVMKLYSMLDKGRNTKQLTWYHSGSGIDNRPTLSSISLFSQVVGFYIGVVHGHLERTVMDAYQWLSENYEEGDRIFLFGFSTGAYQVRVLSAMVDTIGLIHKGDEKRILSAYELYNDTRPSSTSFPGSAFTAELFNHFLLRHRNKDRVTFAQLFKDTFSQRDVRVHFVGVWDTALAFLYLKGILPRIVDGMKHVCYFRHALALDERRVMFLPVYAHGGMSTLSSTKVTAPRPVSDRESIHLRPQGLNEPPQILEVWFAGTHIDIGGGDDQNPNLSLPPLRWMVYEARGLGLRTRLFERETLQMGKLKSQESLIGSWFMEIIPWRRFTYTSHKEGKEMTNWPHLGASRKIHLGQRIHISVIDGLSEYHPQACPPEDVKELWRTIQSDIVSQSIWQAVDGDAFVKPLVARFVRNRDDSAWKYIYKTASSGDGLQAVYEEVMRFLTVATDHYKANNDDVLRLLEHTRHLFSKKSLRLWDVQQLNHAMVEISESSNREYQTTAWKFLSNFLQFSSDMVVPVQFLQYNVDRFCENKTKTSYNVLQKITANNEHPWQVLHESVIERLLNGDRDRRWILTQAKTILDKHPISLHTLIGIKDKLSAIQQSESANHKNAVWTFLDQFTNCQCLQWKGHANTIWSVEFSPDGRRIVSASKDKTLRLWDALTGAQIGYPLVGHTAEVNCVTFSPDGKCVVSGSDDFTLRIWDAATGEQIGGNMAGHQHWIESVAFSPDGKRIVSGSADNTLRIWNAQTGERLGQPLKGHTDIVYSAAFSPDGRTIVSGSLDSTIRIWDAEKTQQLGQLLKGHQDSVFSVVFSPDGKQIASGSYDNTIWLWDPQTGNQIGQPLVGHEGVVYSVAFSPDGKRVVSGSQDYTVRIWDTSTGKQIGRPMRGHSSYVMSVAFSPDGTQVVSGFGDGTICVWDVSLKLWDMSISGSH